MLFRLAGEFFYLVDDSLCLTLLAYIDECSDDESDDESNGAAPDEAVEFLFVHTIAVVDDKVYQAYSP